MRVLYVSFEGRMAGAEQSLLLLLRWLRGRVEPIVACPAQSEMRMLCRDEGVGCEELPAMAGGNPLSKARCFRATLQLRRLAKHLKPHIIHANNFHAMAIASLSHNLSGSGLIWHARDLPKAGFLTRWCSAKAERIIDVSNTIRNSLADLGVSDKKVDVVYNGIDPLPDGIPAAEAGNSSFTFACVGQIVRWKNQEDFLKASEIVHRQLPRVRFMLVGSDLFGRCDSYEAQLKDMIESRRMSWVQWVGWQKDMLSIWRQTDCLVHTAQMEPFGRVLIEAMAHGCPVVAFASGGPAEIVADGESGLLVPFGDVQGLSEAMVRIARQPALAESMGQAARRRAAEQFSADKTAEGVMAVYRKVMEKH